MPGAGKSTIGRLLAKRLGFSFVDTDKVMEAEHGMTLQRLLDRLGPSAFMIEEAKAVTAALHGAEKRVLSPGGSVVYLDEVMPVVYECSVVVYLEVPVAELERRIGGVPRGIVGAASLGELFATREPLYRRWAHCTVDGTADTRAVVDAIALHLEKTRALKRA